jgi:hypothetical protein
VVALSDECQVGSGLVITLFPPGRKRRTWFVVCRSMRREESAFSCHVKGREQRAEGREQRVKSREQRVKSKRKVGSKQ